MEEVPKRVLPGTVSGWLLDRSPGPLARESVSEEMYYYETSSAGSPKGPGASEEVTKQVGLMVRNFSSGPMVFGTGFSEDIPAWLESYVENEDGRHRFWKFVLDLSGPLRHYVVRWLGSQLVLVSVLVYDAQGPKVISHLLIEYRDGNVESVRRRIQIHRECVECSGMGRQCQCPAMDSPPLRNECEGGAGGVWHDLNQWVFAAANKWAAVTVREMDSTGDGVLREVRGFSKQEYDFPTTSCEKFLDLRFRFISSVQNMAICKGPRLHSRPRIAELSFESVARKITQPSKSLAGVESNERREDLEVGKEGHPVVNQITRRPSFICEKCGASFQLQKNLSRHLRRHAKAGAFPCGICGRPFRQSAHLRLHVSMVHEGVKPYACGLCDRRFGSKSNLSRHGRSVHSAVVDTVQGREDGSSTLGQSAVGE